MAKKKASIWLYILFGLLLIGIYLVFLLNGVNLIALYAVPIAALIFKWIVRLGKKWFGWNMSFLLREDVYENAKDAIVEAEKKGIRQAKKTGKKIAGGIRSGWAKRKVMKTTGMSWIKAHYAVSAAYGKVRKEHPDIFKNEKKNV